MEITTAGGLLRGARIRHGLSQEALRAGIAQVVVCGIEADRISPTVEMLRELLELVGEDLVLGAEERETGIDLTLNQGNLNLSIEHRVQKGLTFADVVRQNRRGGAEGLGRLLQPEPLLGALACHRVDFVVIGGIAGLAHGSAYPTYDLDVAYAGGIENLTRLVAALMEIGVQICDQELDERDILCFATEFGTLDILRQVPGVATYEQLRRDSSCKLLAGVAVKVASLNHLIAMKRAGGKRKDQLMAMEYVELADEIRRRDEES